MGLFFVIYVANSFGCWNSVLTLIPGRKRYLFVLRTCFGGIPGRKKYPFVLGFGFRFSPGRFWSVFLLKIVYSGDSGRNCIFFGRGTDFYRVARRICLLPGGPARRSRVKPAERSACLTVPLLQ